MAKITTLQSNLNAGELSPPLGGHIDLDRYANGVKVMLNAIPQIEGGSRRRFGFRQIASTKSTFTTRLVPFVFSKSQAYVVELGEQYARFYTVDGQILQGGVPIELATPWTAAQVFSLEYTQNSDTMFVAHPSMPIKRMVRVLQTTWSLGDAPFDPSPVDEVGERPPATLTLSATTGTISVASAAAVFLQSDIGRNIVAGSGIAEITAVSSGSAATAIVRSAFSGTSFAQNAWKLDQSPLVAITPSNATPVGGSIALVAAGPPFSVGTISQTSSTVTVTTNGAHGYSVGNRVVLSGFQGSGIDGLYDIATVPTPTTFTFSFGGQLIAGGTLGAVYQYGVGQAWRAQDVGAYVEINGGLVELTAFDSATRMYGVIKRELSSTLTAPSTGWTLKSAMWNAIDGYPAAVSLFKQRLYAAGSSGYPMRLWASGIGLYLDFTPGTNDGDAFGYDMASDQVNQTVHLASAKILAALTQGEEFTVTGGTTGAITPTNIDVDSQSVYGCAQARPVRVGNEIIYAQRAGTKIRAMTYDLNTDAYRSQNLTRLAAHVTGPGIVDMAFQAEPVPIVWMVRSDGVLVSMTYDRDDNVCGFARHTTDGAFKSVCSIPGADGDVLFAVVQRTVNGQTVQFVERLDETLQTDAAIVGSNPTGSATWGSLGSLEGKKCDVKADGVYMGQFTVTDGSITLPRTAEAVEIGLHYDSEITFLSPNVSGGLGTSQGNQQRTGAVILRFLNTIRCLVGDQILPFRHFGTNVLDKPPEPFTGDINISEFGWGPLSEITIKQDQPYDWYVLALIRQFTVNAG
ncbi:hypothetical protein QZM89_22250 [Burkholderia gladioli]|uniref:hypothetical protein n=1 Tax=Burkholderia gladioli TaxID=28095 RepID=UPI00264F4186|nr:hypothetical protein [Burkholderia gladioli]MDN7497927.1 hypothetical protein [Burkholderia gladioli]